MGDLWMDPGDADILALLATDLRHSYERLISTYWHRLKVFVLRQVGSPQDAEDIVQEAFVRAYYALEGYPAQRILALKVRPWLYKITWSVYCNYTERSKLQQSVPLDISEDSAFLELEADGHEQPEEAFENEERRRELIALVDTLPQRYREVVSLHYFEDLSYQEIAFIFNQPAGTVRVAVHRGIGMLRKALEAHNSSAPIRPANDAIASSSAQAGRTESAPIRPANDAIASSSAQAGRTESAPIRPANDATASSSAQAGRTEKVEISDGA